MARVAIAASAYATSLVRITVIINARERRTDEKKKQKKPHSKKGA